MINSAAEFAVLRTSDDPADYRRAATDVATYETWRDVIENYPHLRIWVAHNKTVPLEILEILAGDANPEVRAAVAMKNKLSMELLLGLSEDEDESVRERIAYNKSTPLEVLTRMTCDPCDRVAGPSRKRLSLRRPSGSH